MDNEATNINDSIDRLLKLSRQNVLANDCTYTLFTNKKKDNPQAEAEVLSTKLEMYEILSEKSPEEREIIFDSLDKAFERMIEICHYSRLKNSNGLIDVNAMYNMKIRACVNVEKVYYEALTDHFVNSSTKAMWMSSEIDYQNEVNQIKSDLANFPPKEVQKLKRALALREKNLHKKLAEPLSINEQALADQESRAFKLLAYLSAELADDEEQISIPCTKN